MNAGDLDGLLDLALCVAGEPFKDGASLRRMIEAAGLRLVSADRLQRLEEVERTLERSQLTLCGKAEELVLRAAKALAQTQKSMLIPDGTHFNIDEAMKLPDRLSALYLAVSALTKLEEEAKANGKG